MSSSGRCASIGGAKDVDELFNDVDDGYDDDDGVDDDVDDIDVRVPLSILGCVDCIVVIGRDVSLVISAIVEEVIDAIVAADGSCTCNAII